MGKLLDRIERLLMGYTAEERVDIQRRYIEHCVDQRLAEMVAGLDADADHEAWMRDVRAQEEQADHD